MKIIPFEGLRKSARRRLSAKPAVPAHATLTAFGVGAKQQEEQLLRAQRMENIGMLAAGIAHDLNNVLAPILIAAPLLRASVRDPAGLQMLDTVQKSAERGASLVRQILAFSKGGGDPRQSVQLQSLLSDLSTAIVETFPKNIRFEAPEPGNLWPIHANPTQIYQVLLNLCINARDAMPDGGRLTLDAENRVLDATAARAIAGARPGAFLVLRIADTGTGIRPEVLARMWEPFYTTKETGQGTGLGLSTVRGIVEAHHGFVDLDTRVGHGTCFRVWFPAAAEIPAGTPGAPPDLLVAAK